MCRIIRDLESGIGNANHGVERATVKLCVVDCVGDCIRLAIPERAVGQNVGDEIDAAMIFARADFVSVHHLHRRKLVFRSQAHSGYWISPSQIKRFWRPLALGNDSSKQEP
jgi:hypothetical protein